MQLNFWAAVMTLAICHCVLVGVVAFNLAAWLSIRKICQTIQQWNRLRLGSRDPLSQPSQQSAFGDGQTHGQGRDVAECLSSVADAKLAQAEHKLAETVRAVGLDKP